LPFADARMVRLEREQRREIVAEMRSAGMSTRAIGSALGVGNKTVARDIEEADVSDDTPEPAKVVGLDGKTYPHRPAAR
jgi:IS30 family transposase